MLLNRPLNKKTKYRISGIEYGFFIFLAGITDLLTLIPLVGMALGWLFWSFFYIYLIFIRGIVPKKGIIPGIASTFAEFIPGVQMFPTIIIGVIIIINRIRREDRKKSLSIQEKKASPEHSEEFQGSKISSVQ